MKKKPLIPFSWMPGSWGLRGKTREIAQAEYELDQGELQERLLEINYRDDPELLARKKLDLQLSFREIDQYQYEIALTVLTHPAESVERALAQLDVDLKHNKITQPQYDRKRADALKEPWISMPKINWDPVNSNRTYFELDYNEHFIPYLRENGYTGSEDDVLNRWLNDVCQAVALENVPNTGMDFVVDNTRQ